MGQCKAIWRTGEIFVRSLIIIGMLFSLMLPIILKPHIGVLVWDWVSHMVPHKETYGRAYNMEFLDYVAALTVGGLFLSRDRIHLPLHPIIIAIGIYFVWVIFTTIAGFSPSHSLTKFTHISKVLIFAVLSIMIMRSPNRLKAFVAVMGLSLAYYSVKGGLFTIATGGQYRVTHGNGMFSDNNHFAMAFSMAVPLAFYYAKHPPINHWIVRWGLFGVGLLTIASVVGTHSRGGLIALSAVLGAMALFSRRRILLISLAVPLALGGLTLLPDNWKNRMSTVNTETAGGDESFRGRVVMWRFSSNLASEHPIEGGGFDVFYQDKPLERFLPPGGVGRAPHSVYFEVLGEHGYIGLFLFLTTLFTGWFVGGSAYRKYSKYKETLWLGDLAQAMRLGFIGFAVGGLTVNIATFDLYWHFLAILVMIDTVGARLLTKQLTHVNNSTLAGSNSKQFQLPGHSANQPPPWKTSP